MLIFLLSISNIVLLRVRRSGTAALLNGVKKRKSLFNFLGIFRGNINIWKFRCHLHHYCGTTPEKHQDFIVCKKKGWHFVLLEYQQKQIQKLEEIKEKNENIKGHDFFRLQLRGWFRAYSRECLGQRLQVYEQPWLTHVRVRQSMIIKHNHKTLSRCAHACVKESECCSYEFSPTYLQCNLNKECRPTEKKFRDFLFCKKTEHLTPETNE